MAYLGTKPANALATSAQIADGAVSTVDLADSAVTAAKIANSTITDTKLALGAINTQALSLFNASGSAPVYACRAWVNFNGTGTVAIRSSGNVSSITDNGTGDYTVNFTTAMPDVNYSAVYTGRAEAAAIIVNEINPSVPAKTTGSIRIITFNTAFNLLDTAQINVSIFR